MSYVTLQAAIVGVVFYYKQNTPHTPVLDARKEVMARVMSSANFAV